MASVHMSHIPSPYTPSSDVLDRHEYGVTKNRKPSTSSTGGGRAWSEDEEAYLLQTRLQKMPYKHIAAHLKKTELACRLHYHQLSHGNSRRKRTNSCSSTSSPGQSPVMLASAPSPVHESAGSPLRSGSPASYVPASPSQYMQQQQQPRASLADHHGVMGGAAGAAPPRLPAILPRPTQVHMPPARSESPAVGRGVYHHHVPMLEPHPILAPANFPLHIHHHNHPSHHQPGVGHPTTTTPPPPLHLDCSALPPPPPHLQTPPQQQQQYHQHQHHMHIDMARLGAVYTVHRASFWAAVAAEYGAGASAAALEQAFRSGYCCGQTATPITPISSPDAAVRDDSFDAAALPPAPQPAPPSRNSCSDKTRISAILGIDANPRSPSEREMVRRMEEERRTMV